MAARLAFARAFASKGPKGVNPFVAWNAFTAETFETTKAELESRGELPTGASPRERRNSVLSALSLKWHAMSDEEKKAWQSKAGGTAPASSFASQSPA